MGFFILGNTQNCENKTIDQMRQEVEQIFNKHYGMSNVVSVHT